VLLLKECLLLLLLDFVIDSVRKLLDTTSYNLKKRERHLNVKFCKVDSVSKHHTVKIHTKYVSQASASDHCTTLRWVLTYVSAALTPVPIE
jgi:hypothetical protein